MTTPDQRIGLPGAQKLTRWTKEPTVLDLKSDLEAAKPWHDSHVINVRRWNDLRNVRNSAKPKAQKNRSEVQPKLIRRQAEWRYSALSEPFLSSQAIFSVEPRTFEDTFAAEQNQTLINWQFSTKINKVRFIDEYVRTAVDEGTVIVRLGWDRQSRMKTIQVPVYEFTAPIDEAELEPLMMALQMKEQNPRGYEEDIEPAVKAAVDFFLESGQQTVAIQIGMEDAEEEEILVNKPTLDILNPANVYIDSSCQGDIDKAKFAIITFESSKAELLKDGRYKNLNAVNWSGNTVLNTPDHQSETPTEYQLNDDLRKPIVVHEYHGFYDVDGNEELKPIVAAWIGDTMIRMEPNPFPDEKIPLVVVPYLPIRGQLMGEPDAEILEDNQKILGAVTRGMIDLLGRSANSQQAMPKGFLDATNKRRFEQGLDYEYNPGQFHPSQAIHQHVYPEIPNSAITMVGMQNHDAEALSGVKAFAGGLSGEAYGDVATGIKGVLDAAAKREMNILRRLAWGMMQIGIKIMSMNAVFLSEKEVIRVTNKKFVTIRREDLKGNFDLVVDIATPEVDQARADDLGFMLQTMGPDMDPELSRMILAKIAKLKRMPDLEQALLTYEPKPDPLIEKARELEIAKLEAEIAKLESEAAENRAQARKYDAEADLADLNFVEEETGTKHMRELEKQGAQARANQDLEVTKALVKERDPEKKQPDVATAVGFNAMT